MSTPESRLPLYHVVGLSGHTQVTDKTRIRNAIRRALEQILGDWPTRWVAFSSIAYGADTLFVQEALDLNLSWNAILPMPLALFREDFDTDQWSLASHYLAKAISTQTIPESPSREDGYLDAGYEVVHHSDVIIAVWDGLPARGKGGTGDIVTYAREVEKPLVIIDSGSFGIRSENLHHFKVQDDDLEILNRLHSAKNVAPENVFGAPDELINFQLKTDEAATQASPHFRALAASTVVFNVLATLISTAALAFSLQWTVLFWL